jgi:hypothetical protein
MVTDMYNSSLFTFTTDAVYAPPKYGGTVMLVSDDTYQGIGGVAVFQSNDGCASATLLGEIPNNFSVATYGVPSASVQIAQSIFAVEGFFFDTSAFDVAGTWAGFLFVDVTDAVDDLVCGD